MALGDIINIGSTQSALNNNILLLTPDVVSVDSSMAKGFSLQLVFSSGISAGAVTFEGSNDGVNYVPVFLFDITTVNPTNVSSVTAVASTTKVFQGNLSLALLRVRISTAFVGGTVQACWRFLPSDFVPFVDQITKISDGTNAVTIRGSGSIAAVTDGSLVASLSPNHFSSTSFYLESAATTNATSVKASAGKMYSLFATNTSAAVKFLKVYNKASAPTVGTDIPIRTYAIPASGQISDSFPLPGKFFSAGIALAITGAIGNADATAVASNDVKVCMDYV